MHEIYDYVLYMFDMEHQRCSFLYVFGKMYTRPIANLGPEIT